MREDAERDRQTTEQLYTDMYTIRAFETVLKNTKERGEHGGVSFRYHGPAHLCIGQEGLSVGTAQALRNEDIAFGTHRGHGDFIARAQIALREKTEAEWERIAKAYPYTLRAVEKVSKSTGKEFFADFIYFGMLSEIFAKSTGFYRGLSGSMHLFLSEIGVYPNNAVVGGSAPLATGAALYKKVNREGGIVVSHIGDGALGCGVVYESMNFAAMDQYRYLWKEEGGLPVLYLVADNGYGMGGQTSGETMAFGIPARLGAGISPMQMHAERVDGMNVFAVADGVKRKREIAKKDGPVLLDVLTYRYEGHSQSDKMSYRGEEEIASWRRYDPIAALERSSESVWGKGEEIRLEIEDRMKHVMRWAADETVAPYFDFSDHPTYFSDVLFHTEKGIESENSEITVQENARVKEISQKTRFRLPTSDTPTYEIRDGLFESVFSAFRRFPKLISYGEEARDWGNVSGVYEGLTEALPYRRLFNAPISEGAIVSTAVGYAMAGGRAIVEMMFADFMGRAGDEIFNQMAKWQAISGGKMHLPVVLRVMVGCKYGTQHSQEWTAFPAHIPGLQVIYPVTPYDAKGMLTAALNGENPVVVFESQRLYGQGEIFREGGVPQEDYEVEIGVPAVRRTGTDVTVITLGAPLYRAIEAAETLTKEGILAEVIDLRSVTPLQYEILVDSVRKTGRVILVSDAVAQGSYMQTVAGELTRRTFETLKKPPLVLGAKYGVTPPYEYDDAFFPQAKDIADGARELCRD